MEWVYWLDEYYNNWSSKGGVIPDGICYERNTKFYFCCRSDGNPYTAIYLPAGKDFVLFKSKTNKCQEVKGMGIRREFAHWDCDDDYYGKVGFSDKTSPYGSTGHREALNIVLDYCYYYPLKGEKIIKKQVFYTNNLKKQDVRGQGVWIHPL